MTDASTNAAVTTTTHEPLNFGAGTTRAAWLPFNPLSYLMLDTAALVASLFAAGVTREPLLVVIALAWASAAVLTGIYAEVRPSLALEANPLLRALVLWPILASAGAFAMGVDSADRARLIECYALTAWGMLLIRLGYRTASELGWCHAPLSRVVIVGSGGPAAALARDVRRHSRWLGLELAGQLDSQAPIGQLSEEVLALKERAHATDVVIMRDEIAGDDLTQLLQRLRWSGLCVRVALDNAGMKVAPSELFCGRHVVRLHSSVLSPLQRALKRAVDVVVSAFLLVVLLPLLMTVAVVVRADSTGAAFFVQERVGESGRRFRMYKFRTMVIDAPKRESEVIRVVDGKKAHKFRDDPRVTRAGRWLRASSLDELPQLVNILKGEMSLVGPRPELPWIVAEYEPWQYERLAVPPGLTGWWQLTRRGDAPMHLHTEYDLYYVANYSFALDIKLLLRTVAVPFSRRGAF